MEGPHAVHQVVTDDTMKHLVEMVMSHVGTGVDWKNALPGNVSTCMDKPPYPLCWWNEWASIPWECLLKR